MITQRHMIVGAWSLSLKDTTPQYVLASLERDVSGFGHVIITPTRMDSDSVTGADLLSVARYTGVYRERPSHYEIGGPGPAMWLADEDGKGDVIENALTKAAGTFVQWVEDLIPDSLTEGTLSAIAGTLQHSFRFVDRRAALGYVCDYFGGEWRVNPDLTLDAGAEDDLFVVDPVVVVQPHSGGLDLNITGLETAIGVESDLDDYTTRTLLVAQGDGATTTGDADISPSTPYKDINGNDLVMTRIIESSDTKPGNEDVVAQAQLNRFTAPREAITLSTDQYDIGGDVQPGDYIFVYDPEQTLYDTDNEVHYRGQTIYPAIQRCLGTTWPVKAGMGVYLRTIDGTIVDLTDWVLFEQGATTIEVGANPRASDANQGSAVLDRPATDTSAFIVSLDVDYVAVTDQATYDGLTPDAETVYLIV